MNLLYQLWANGICVLLVFRARNRIRDCIERAVRLRWIDGNSTRWRMVSSSFNSSNYVDCCAVVVETQQHNIAFTGFPCERIRNSIAHSRFWRWNTTRHRIEEIELHWNWRTTCIAQRTIADGRPPVHCVYTKPKRKELKLTVALLRRWLWQFVWNAHSLTSRYFFTSFFFRHFRIDSVVESFRVAQLTTTANWIKNRTREWSKKKMKLQIKEKSSLLRWHWHTHIERY